MDCYSHFINGLTSKGKPITRDAFLERGKTMKDMRDSWLILTNLKTVKYHTDIGALFWRNIVAFYFKYFQTSIFSKERSNKCCCLSQKQAQLPIIIRCGLLFILQIFFTMIDCSFWVLLTERGPSSRSDRSYRLKGSPTNIF